MYRRMIYTSLDFITDNSGIGKMTVLHGNDEKRIWPWRKDDVVHKILYKREARFSQKKNLRIARITIL